MNEQPKPSIQENPAKEEIDFKDFEARAKNLIEKFSKMMKEEPVKGESSFEDIAGNFKGSFKTVPGTVLETIEGILRFKPEFFTMKIEYAEKYLELIDKFPDFKRLELSQKFGAYPDLYKEAEQDFIKKGPEDMRSWSMLYIDRVWTLLREKVDK